MGTRSAVIVECVGQALTTIRGYPLRTALAAAAMAAAVATTAVVQTGLNGLERSARDAGARAFGTDSFVITRIATGNLSRREVAERLARNAVITRGDVRFLDRVANQRVVYAATAQRPGNVSAGSRTFENATLNGTQATLFDIRDVGIARGRAFTVAEEVQAAPVIIIGDGVAKVLFPGVDPLDRLARIAGRGFRVIGVQAPQGSGGNVPLDRYVWMPITAYERAFGAAPALQVFAKPVGAATTTAAEDHSRVSMRARRQLAAGAPDSFDIITPEASRSFVAAITARIGSAGPPISLMALVAAIVVVTNTTLVSVTQRTREIGIRRAVGASRTSVLGETLAESSLIAVAGGGAGLAVAAVLLWTVSGSVGIAVALEWRTALGSLAAAALSGTAAGWYPARRAAALDVIAALRQE